METERPHVGRRDRKKSQTRRGLRAAALRLVDQRGLDAVTIEDITEAADVSMRTFSNYFTSKEAALTAPDPERLARLRSQLIARPAGESPLRALQVVLVADTAALASSRDEWLHQITVLKRDPRLLAALAGAWGTLKGELAAGLAERLGARHDALTSSVLAAAAVAALRVAIARWDAETQDHLAEGVRASFEALILAGADAAYLQPAARRRDGSAGEHPWSQGVTRSGHPTPVSPSPTAPVPGGTT